MKDYLTFIESSNFPIERINEASAKEKQGGGRPPYWEMVFWWTRKPLAGARAVIAGALLPQDFNVGSFLSMLKLITDKVSHRLNPTLPSNLKEQFKQIKLLDPFAGFGSIPLEAIRLSIGEVVAVEFLPVAYIFLKAVLEYPKKYGKQLKADVEKWGKWVIEKLREDQDIRELYNEDVAVYIGTWEVKCPICGRYTPLVGNWWLARVKGKKYAYMKPKAEGNNVSIEIVEGRTEGAPTPNVRGRPELAECLLCGSRITYVDPKTSRIYRSKGEVRNKLIRDRLEFYPKHAINDWNQKLEEYLEERISLEALKRAKARPRLLVKVKVVGKDLKFETCNEKDNEKIWKALKKLKRMWRDPDLPTEPVPPYQTRTITPILGVTKWYQFFNPRQLLTLVKLVKLIREAGKRAEEEYQVSYADPKPLNVDKEEFKQKLERIATGKLTFTVPHVPPSLLFTDDVVELLLSGKFREAVRLISKRFPYLLPTESQRRKATETLKELTLIALRDLRDPPISQESFKYAEAVTTYLAIALVNYALRNSIVSPYYSATMMRGFVEKALTFRGIAMIWNWGELCPWDIFVVGTFIRCVKGQLNALSYLVSAVSGSSSRVRVLLDDATVLSKLSGEKFDVIVTDPPYRDDVPYSELSDFYYVWLKRALSDDNLAPRFHADALIYNTQWESFALNEISYNEGRLNYFGVKEAGDYYEKLMGMAFKKMAEVLKDNGLIITYFAHSNPEAWIELVETGWKRAGLKVTRAWNFATESLQRVIARGKTALESSIVVVWRKRKKIASKIGDYKEVYKEALDNAKEAKERALKSGLTGSDLFLATMIGALATFTSYDGVLKFGRELTSRDVVRESYAIATRVIANATETIKSPEALFYLASKAVYRVYSKPSGQLIIEGVSGEPIILSSQDVIILSYGFLRESLEKPEKEGVKMFVKANIIRGIEKDKGAKVAQQKMFTLLEPLDPSLKSIKDVLGKRNVNPVKMVAFGRPLNTIDVLHLLEYYAKQGKGEFDLAYQTLYNRNSRLVREAIEVARVIARFSNDPESALARLCVEYIEGG